MSWISLILAAAEEEQKQPPQPAAGGDLIAYLPFLAIPILFYFLIYGPQRRERNAREALLSALKKNDKVLTTSGIIGTIANISPDGKEVTLKVDDNARIRMLRSSIHAVISGEAEPEKLAETK